ncbi:MAG: S24/S26 family peptidase [Oscillospiraceae bacterium]|nr:S24/S26 family peptidase [Oscillospiraceae bacterium]
MPNTVKIETSLNELMPIMCECLEAGKSFRFSPRGISMLPMLREGKDSVLLSPVDGKLKKYDIPLYQRDNGKYVLHRIVSVGETYTCIGDNQFSYENGIRDDQIIAVVTGFYRKEKFISIENPLYKIYCAIWDKSRGLRNFWRRGIGFLRRHLK